MSVQGGQPLAVTYPKYFHIKDLTIYGYEEVNIIRITRNGQDTIVWLSNEELLSLFTECLLPEVSVERNFLFADQQSN